jgi:NADH dehydrogenase
MPGTVCVLGGSGFIGSALTARLAGRGRTVKVLSRNPARHPGLKVLPTVVLLRADVHDPAVLVREFRDCDAVVNLVGILNERGFSGRGFRRAHAELAGKAAAACVETGVRRLVQMSALNADGERGPSHYLRSKGEAENAVRRICTTTEYAIVRPSVVFGPGDSLLNRFARLLRRMPGVFPLACAEAKFAPVFVDDVVAALTHCIDAADAAGRSYELCGPDVLSLAEIVRLTARAAGLRRLVVPLPRPISRLQAAIMDLVPGKPFSTDNFLSASVDSVCTTNGFAELGIRPVSIHTMLPRSLR